MASSKYPMSLPLLVVLVVKEAGEPPVSATVPEGVYDPLNEELAPVNEDVTVPEGV